MKKYFGRAPMRGELARGRLLAEGPGASLRIKCGDYSGANPNVCVLSLPTLGYSPNVRTGLMRPLTP